MTEPKTYVRMRGLLYYAFKFLFRPTIIDNDKIPESGRIVIAGNHTHFMDCISLAASTKRCVHFLAKSELMKPPLKWFFAPFGIIPVHRGQKDKAALSSAIEVLEDDKVIGIFPEGTRNKVGAELLPFKEGSFKMAEKTGCLIIPVALSNTAEVFENHLPWVKSCKVVVEYGTPIDPKTLSREEKKHLGAYCRDRIQEMLDKNQSLV